MKKRTISIVLTLAIIVCIFAFAACDKTGGGSNDGTYYLYKNGALDKSDYYTLKGGKWTDSDGTSGTVKISNGKIEFLTELFGSEEVLVDGTISDGVIKLTVFGEVYYYCKEGKTPPNSSNNSDNSDNSGSGNQNNDQNNKPATTAKKYDVTYNANSGLFADGSNTLVQKAEENSLLTAPASPTRQGYSFTGWSKTKNGSDMWQFAENKVTENTTLYAQWTEKTAVILSVDGASIEDNSILMIVNHTVDYVSLATKVVCSSDSTWRLYYDRLGLTEIPTKIAAQKTTGALSNGDNVFYMVVTSQDGTQINTYELTIHRSYLVNINYVGVYGTTVETKSTYSGYEYSANYTPSFTGYTFNYWKDDKGKRVTAFIPFASTTLYADYTAKTYTATLNVNGGNALSKTEYTVTYDSSYSFSKPSRTGYTFMGWYIGSTQITNANGSSISAWKYASNQTVTAHWQANEYTVTLNRSNSSAGTVSGDGEHNYDSNVTISASTNNGYTWVGWYDSNDTLVTTNTSYTFKMGLGATYTAKWKISDEMLPFTFTSTASTCTITGIKDKTVTEIIVPEYVTSINKGAFSGCSNLQSITIPFVGGSANATSASSSTLFGYIFGTYSYTGGTATKQYYASGSSTTYYIPTSLRSVTITGGKNIYYGAFYNCSTLTSIEIPSSVTSISEGAFYKCSSLTSIEIPSSVTSIGDKAFQYCSKLTSIEIPSGVTSIGSGAFSGCSNLESIMLPFVGGSASATSASSSTLFGYIFGTSSYAGGTATTQYYKGDDYNGGNYTTYYIPTSLNSVTITGGKNIYYGAFSYCRSLTSIEIPSSVTSIDSSYAFYHCYSLTIYCERSSAPSGWAYYWNSSRPVVWNSKNNEVATDGNIYYIADNGIRYALKDGVATVVRQSTGLSGDIVIPSSVTHKGVTYSVAPSIGSSAFEDCRSLTSIVIPSSVTSIGSQAFYGSTLTIYCEVSSKPSGWSSWWNIMSGAGSQSPRYCPVVWGYNNITTNSEYDYVVHDSKVYLTKYKGTSTNVTIPETIDGKEVVSIGSTFDSNTTIQSLVIPSSVTRIGSYAFYNCSSLTSIEIPSSVISIGSDAFYGCSSLTSVTFKNTNGWYRTSSFTATSGTSIDVTNAQTNATNLVSTYTSYYWKRNA